MTNSFQGHRSYEMAPYLSYFCNTLTLKKSYPIASYACPVMQGWFFSCALGLPKHPRSAAGSPGDGVIPKYKALLYTVKLGGQADARCCLWVSRCFLKQESCFYLLGVGRQRDIVEYICPTAFSVRQWSYSSHKPSQQMYMGLCILAGSMRKCSYILRL